jgi:aldehyde:ferredoxin oxidoreductase
MADEVCGYTGRLLRVDLTRRSFAVEEIPRAVMAEVIGGRGFVARYVYDEVAPGTDPLGPENKIYFATGPLTGTRMPSSGRYVVGTLSPLTGAYIRSVSGGAWGAFLKFAGYDMLSIEGTSEEWCYLSITSNGAEFRDARPMTGMLTEETEEAIRRDLGNPRARCAVIGPAGEKLVRHACIQTERRSAGRGGVGCVMGAKRLKGIAVCGETRPRLYKQEAFDALMKAHVRRNHGGAYYSHFHPLGTTGGVGLTYTLGVHPVANFSRGVFAGIENLMPEAIRGLDYKKRDTGCWNCYMKCGSIFDVPAGPFKGAGYENPEYETMWSFGANCLNQDFAAILAANKVCDDFGADTISTGNAVAFLAECRQKGYITAADLNGVALKWGDAAAMVAVAQQIVNRESPAGNLIADGGVRHAARVIGRDAPEFAMHAKGLELAAYDPRGLQGHGLGYAVSTIGGSHQIGYGVQELFGFPEKVDRFSARDKGRHTIWANRYITIFDCAVACGFANAFTESRLDFATFREWLVLATGMDAAFGAADLMDAAFDRIYNLEHAFNRRMGLTAADDTLPGRVRREALPDGPSAGHLWQRDELVQDYYRARGWDAATGVPLRPTLERLNLEAVADDLEREGLLPQV